MHLESGLLSISTLMSPVQVITVCHLHYCNGLQMGTISSLAPLPSILQTVALSVHWILSHGYMKLLNTVHCFSRQNPYMTCMSPDAPCCPLSILLQPQQPFSSSSSAPSPFPSLGLFKCLSLFQNIPSVSTFTIWWVNPSYPSKRGLSFISSDPLLV